MRDDIELTTGEPYKELLIVDYPDDTNGYPDVYYICNTCGTKVDDAPCAEHAPLNVPGLVLVDCDATPRHYMWTVDSEGYPSGCVACGWREIYDKHSTCEHSHHGPWRRWRITKWANLKAYSLGITGGHGASYGGGCHGCVTRTRWRGSRSYVLGWPTWKWSCLLRKRHWPGHLVGLGCCTKCLPCPDCGSTSADCIAWCDNQAVAR